MEAMLWEMEELVGRKTDRFEIPVVELKEVGVFDVSSCMVKRVGDRIPVDGADIRQEVNQLVSQPGFIKGGGIGRNRGCDRSDFSGGLATWGNDGDEYQEQHYEQDVFGPPDYSSGQLHSGPREEIPKRVLTYYDNSVNGSHGCQPVTSCANPCRRVTPGQMN